MHDIIVDSLISCKSNTNTEANKMNNLRYFLALNRMRQIGPRTILKLLKRWPNLEELFLLKENELELAGLPSKLVTIIKDYPLNKTDDDFLWAETNNHHLICLDSPLYPNLLKEIYAPPIILYAKGNINVFNSTCLAIVGSRKPSITGQENAKNFAYDLALNGLTIVSGLALGIDAEAHRGTLMAKGKTIAVMGTGIDQIYPRAHSKLAEEISENGLIISEFPLKISANPRHFPQRNRIISGLSLSTLVIEAAISSGSLITARFALEQNRDVLAIPSSIHNPVAAGCHHLLKQGAKLVTKSQDVLEELNLPILNVKEKKEPTLAINDKKLVKCIGFEITSIDELVTRSGLDVGEIMILVTNLELAGVIKAVPGGYMRC